MEFNSRSADIQETVFVLTSLLTSSAEHIFCRKCFFFLKISLALVAVNGRQIALHKLKTSAHSSKFNGAHAARDTVPLKWLASKGGSVFTTLSRERRQLLLQN